MKKVAEGGKKTKRTTETNKDAEGSKSKSRKRTTETNKDAEGSKKRKRTTETNKAAQGSKKSEAKNTIPKFGTDKHDNKWRLEMRNARSKNPLFVLRKLTAPPAQLQLSMNCLQH
eukprot:2949934-Amphidinium_carterae.1